MGLKDPIHIQLINFYRGLLKGDLGKSITYRPDVDVVSILKAKIPYSLKSGLAA